MVLESVMEDGSAVPVEHFTDSDIIVAAPSVGAEIGATDVLTQAMTEIFNTHDFRTSGNIAVHPDTIQFQRLLGNGGAVIQVSGRAFGR
jgi:hypothetical protein